MSRPMIEIVAHRGATQHAPENTLAAFHKARELGADYIELDVRLSADRKLVVFHYFYLDKIPGLSGPVFSLTARELQERSQAAGQPIPLLDEVLEELGGRIGMEIEIKGPEPEAAPVTAAVLQRHKKLWPTLEVTSYEPALLCRIRELCPGLPVDLLFPRSEPWMGLDVVAYTALHRARLAGARAVHLHPTQLAPQVVDVIRSQGIEIHAWDVNDGPAVQTVADLNISRLCTDRLEWALSLRENIFA